MCDCSLFFLSLIIGLYFFFYTSYRVVFRSGEGVTSAASTSQVPTSHLPVQASQKSLSFYSLMLVSARKIDAPKGGRCCRYSGCCGTCMPQRGGASLENLSALLGSLLEINCADEYKMFDEFYLMIFSFSFTTHAHRHALFTQSTLCHTCCFVSSATVCGYSIKRFWKVLLPHVFFCQLVLQAWQMLLLNIGNSSKKNSPDQMLQINYWSHKLFSLEIFKCFYCSSHC